MAEQAVKKKPGRKKKEEVVESTGQTIQCGFAVVMLDSGDISVQLLGNNQNLVVLDGLLKYAERYLEREWKPRLENKSEE